MTENLIAEFNKDKRVQANMIKQQAQKIFFRADLKFVLSANIKNEKTGEVFPYPVGQMAVIEETNLKVRLPFIRSKVSAKVIKILVENGITFEQHPKTIEKVRG